MECFNILYPLKLNVISILLLINSQVKEVDSFLIVYKYKDRFTRPFKRTLTMLTKMFGNFWTNVVIVVNFWSFKKVNMLNDMYILNWCNSAKSLVNIFVDQIHDDERRTIGVTPQKYSRQLTSLFEQKFDLDKGSIPLVFIDTHYNR